MKVTKRIISSLAVLIMIPLVILACTPLFVWVIWVDYPAGAVNPEFWPWQKGWILP